MTRDSIAGKRKPETDDAHRAFRRAVRRLVSQWHDATCLQEASFRVDARLTRSLGRANIGRARVTVSPAVAHKPALLDEVITHELAHLLAHHRHRGTERLHGPTWQGLMREAGHEPRRLASAPPAMGTRSKRAAGIFRHRCPVCQSTRRARRAMPAWRCAGCVANGLAGELVIDRLSSP